MAGFRGFGPSMTRKIILSTVILTTAFFLVTLGFRNPMLSHNHGPKQRPRAVVENVFKASVEICDQQQVDAEACQSIALPVLAEAQSFSTFVGCDTVAPTLQYLHSRAPPSPSSRFS
jgi:hypothetical protein